MTVVVFNSGILTVTTPSWCATELRDADKPLIQVHVLGSPSVAKANLPMTMMEFLALIADGGKIVDLRGMQEPELLRRTLTIC
jgi:hypothetical protein